MATPQDAWSSHIWTEQTLMRLIGSSQQQVEIRTNERMPQSFMVPQSLLRHYCPKLQPDLALPGQPFVLETTRPALTLFFNWLYTGKLDTADWHSITELYFLSNLSGCVALSRSAMSQLQKCCRNDQSNRTELFHYEHISVIEEMVGASSSLSRYVEDTYFNHWNPEDDDGVNDDPSNYSKSSLFFKRLFQRSFKEQKEVDNCSCCHEYCKYHDHESEAERLATCGPSSSSVARPSTDAPHIVKSTPVVHKARKSKAAVRTSLNSVLVSGIDDDSSYETRKSRSGTPKGKAAVDTWLTVQSLAPVDYPAEYHGLLTSLPQVQSIKPSNWLEIGVEAEGVDRLPEPDRIIAAAMSWNAEDYAQTKCTFFNQYDATIIDRHHWLNTLKFGGSKSKEKGEKLMAMWEALGWLEPPATVANDQSRSNPVTSNSTEVRQSGLFGHSWSEEEKNAVAKIMRDIETDKSCKNMGLLECAKRCSERLSSEYGHHRTEKAVRTQWKKMQELVDSFAMKEHNEAGQAHQPVCDTLVPENNGDLIEVFEGKRVSPWTPQEEEAMLGIMDALERHPTHKDTTIKQRADTCKLRLKSRFGTDRTSVAITIQYHAARRKKDAARADASTKLSANDSAIDGAMPIILKDSVAAVNDSRNRSTGHNDASSTMSKSRWSDIEDQALLKVFKEIEEDPSLLVLTEHEKSKVCSARLHAKHKIVRNAESVKQRWHRLSLSSHKRKADDTDDWDDHEPLMTRKKRKEGESRFVAELFDAGED